MDGFAPAASRELADLIARSESVDKSSLSSSTQAAAQDGARTIDSGNEASQAGRKVSYAIPCSSKFRDAVQQLADRKEVNVGDIARSVMLTLSMDTIEEAEDPGEPGEDDRETVILKSGRSAGKPWRRKPRLQVRLPAGAEIITIRKALGIALSLEKGDNRLSLESAIAPTWESMVGDLHDRIARLQATVATLAFEPLPNGVRTRAEALHVLGYPGDAMPGASAIKNRFRMLAAIHHPDSEFGDTARMSQLNQAMALLKRG